MNIEQAAEPKPENTVTMIFPHRIVLTMAHGTSHEFLAGVHEVKASLADHWYLKAHGVKKYEPDAPSAAPAAPAAPAAVAQVAPAAAPSRVEIVKPVVKA